MTLWKSKVYAANNSSAFAEGCCAWPSLPASRRASSCRRAAAYPAAAYGFRSSRHRSLADKEMMVAAACDLVAGGSRTHHLRGLAQLAPLQLADHGGGRAADADVHFVENQRRGFHFTRGDHLESPAQCATVRRRRPILAIGCSGWPGLSGDAELNMVGAVGGEMAFINATSIREDPVRHRKWVHTFGDKLGQPSALAWRRACSWRAVSSASWWCSTTCWLIPASRRCRPAGAALPASPDKPPAALPASPDVYAPARFIGKSVARFKRTVRIEIQTVMVVAQLVAGLASSWMAALFQHIRTPESLLSMPTSSLTSCFAV